MLNMYHTDLGKTSEGCRGNEEGKRAEVKGVTRVGRGKGKQQHGIPGKANKCVQVQWVYTGGE